MNLNVYTKSDTATAAETVRSAQTERMPGRDLVSWVESFDAREDGMSDMLLVGVDRRNPKKWTTVIKNVSYLYGHRPKHPPLVWHLSAYEFVSYWKVVLARYPISIEAACDDTCHAELTGKGRAAKIFSSRHSRCARISSSRSTHRALSGANSGPLVCCPALAIRISPRSRRRRSSGS